MYRNFYIEHSFQFFLMRGFIADLRWNEIGPSGATALIGMLKKNKILKDLQLSGNNIPSSLQSEIGWFSGFLYPF